MERERSDGADIIHLLRSRGAVLNRERLFRRFGSHWQLLLAHLVLFHFVYPAEQDRIPAGIVERLLEHWRTDMRQGTSAEKVCQGTLLSRTQYLNDREYWGYEDARMLPRGPMTMEQITHWTAASK
jgi:hypothetical protein